MNDLLNADYSHIERRVVGHIAHVHGGRGLSAAVLAALGEQDTLRRFEQCERDAHDAILALTEAMRPLGEGIYFDDGLENHGEWLHNLLWHAQRRFWIVWHDTRWWIEDHLWSRAWFARQVDKMYADFESYESPTGRWPEQPLYTFKASAVIDQMRRADIAAIKERLET